MARDTQQEQSGQTRRERLTRWFNLFERVVLTGAVASLGILMLLFVVTVVISDQVSGEAKFWVVLGSFGILNSAAFFLFLNSYFTERKHLRIVEGRIKELELARDFVRTRLLEVGAGDDDTSSRRSAFDGGER